MIYQRKKKRLAQGKKCTTTDARYFQIAENLLYMELGAALGKPKEEVCETIIEYIKQKADRKRKRNPEKNLFDFWKNRKYNNHKRVASKRKSSLPATRFHFAKINIAMKKVCSVSA